MLQLNEKYNINNIDELPDDKNINVLGNVMEKMNINDQGGVLEYKINSQNEMIFADTNMAEEEETDEDINNNKDDIGDKTKDYDFNDNEEGTVDPNYTYVDIDEL